MPKPTPWVQYHSAETKHIVLRKSADETVNNSTTLQNDDTFTFTMAANEVWGFRLYLRYNSSTTADIKFAWAGTGISSISWRRTETEAAELTSGTTSTPAASGANDALVYEGVLIADSDGGAATLQWAQNLASAIDTKVLTNSYMVLHKLA